MPRSDQHTVILGQNGSGKSQGAFWLLSKAALDRPWIMLDYKGERMIRSLARAGAIRKHLTPNSRVPTRPGLYTMRLNEGEDEEGVDDFLMRVWAKGRTGLYFDEGMMPPGGHGSALRRILTQGRSLRIPIIACLQRPAFADHYFFTEAKHLWVFRLIDREDRRTVSRYAPIHPDEQWPRYHSRWYDNDRDLLFPLAPVPKSSMILADLAGKAPRHWFWG